MKCRQNGEGKKPTELCSRFEEGGFGHVKIYLEPIVRVYKDKSNEKESDKISWMWMDLHHNTLVDSPKRSQYKNIPLIAKVISSWLLGLL